MPTGYDKRLLRVIAYIEANPAGDLSLDALADAAAMSRFHWHRVFHAMTGETAADVVRRVRMQQAAAWLVQEGWALAEVARRVGYSSPRSFAKAFRDLYGVTPSTFRAQGAAVPPLTLKPKGSRAMYDVTVQSVGPLRLAAVAHKGAYDKISKAFARAGRIVEQHHLIDRITQMIALQYDDPSLVPESKLRSYAGFTLDDGAEVPAEMEKVDVPGGRFAVLRHKGPYSGLPDAFAYLYGRWLPDSGEELRDAPNMEIYHNTPMNAADEDLLTEIRVPIR
jgi:AraC family transcriptional regulator